MKVSPQILIKLCAEYGLKAETEYRFCPERRWRADLRIDKYLIEFEGMCGRHQRYMGFQNDLEKYLKAWHLGYEVIRISWKQFEQGEFDKVLNEIKRRTV